MRNGKEKVLLLENIHADAHRAFEAKGYQVESLAKSLPEAALREALVGITALGVRSKTEISGAHGHWRILHRHR